MKVNIWQISLFFGHPEVWICESCFCFSLHCYNHPCENNIEQQHLAILWWRQLFSPNMFSHPSFFWGKVDYRSKFSRWFPALSGSQKPTHRLWTTKATVENVTFIDLDLDFTDTLIRIWRPLLSFVCLFVCLFVCCLVPVDLILSSFKMSW